MLHAYIWKHNKKNVIFRPKPVKTETPPPPKKKAIVWNTKFYHQAKFELQLAVKVIPTLQFRA